MKRTSTSSTQKIQTDISVRANNDALAKLTVGKLPGENSVNANAKSVSPEVNRRVRTSAAMIGLAISMGASGLLLPQQTEEVIAAESNQGSEPTVTTLPNISESAPVALENEAFAVKPEMRTVVSPLSLGQEKAIKISSPQFPLFNQQTGLSGDQKLDTNAPLRQPSESSHRGGISEKHGSSVPKVSISKQSVVKTAAVAAEELKTDNTPAKSSRSESVDNRLKVKQDAALSRLKQQRQRLQNSLSVLQTDPIDQVSTQNQSFELQANLPQSLETTRPVAVPETTASLPPVVMADPVVIPVAPVTPSIQTKSVTTPHKEKPPGLNIPIASTQKQAKTIPAVATQNNKPQGISIPVTPFPSVQNATILSETTTVIKSSAVPSAAPTNTTDNQFTTAQIEPVKSTVQAANRELTYQVKAGDTLDSIAQNYRVSKAELIRINDLHNPDEIRVNQTLKIPFNKSTSVKTAAKPQVITPVLPETPEVNNQSVAINVNTPTSTKRSSSSSSTAINSQSNPYIERLKQDIIKLRQQYQNQNNSNNSNKTASVTEIQQPIPVITPPVTPAVIAPTPTLNNPEFSSGSYKSNPQKLQQPIKVEQPTKVAETSIPITVELPPTNISSTKTQVPTVVVPNKRVIASTPIPVENYNPNLKQPVGTTVSPDTPFNNSPDTNPDNVSPFQGYIWPAKGVLTSGYGWRWGRMHKGIDIAAPVGTPVYAAAPGVIEYARWNSGGYGNLVDIRHADGSLTRYGHNSRLLVREGDTVSQGQQIAEMGSTGFSTGPHSHFEIHPAGKGAVNPIAFLPRR